MDQSEIDDIVAKIHTKLDSLLEKRINLIRLLHENTPMVAMHQDAKFQGVNQEFHAFQSVLGEVMEDLAACSDSKQSKFKKNIY